MPHSDRSAQELVARADREKRARASARLLALASPVAAAVLLVLALTGRFLGWPRWVPIVGLALAAVGLAVVAFLQRRGRPTTDAIASVVDRDASLGGELRSAHWFEANGPLDAWADFHVGRASERAAAIDWSGLYPKVRAGRQWAGSAAMVLGVLALALWIPAATRPAIAKGVLDDPAIVSQLPTDIQKKLAALMAQLEDEALNKDAKQISLEELKKLLTNLDPALQKKLAELLEKQLANAEKTKGLEKDQRPDRAENSAAGLPEDARWAMEDLAAKLAQQKGDRQTNDKNPSASAETGEKGMGSAQAEQKMATSAEAAQALVRESAMDAGAKMMMGGGGPMGGDSRPGAGGKTDQTQGAAEALLLAKALKKDIVEAQADALGENVDKEDLRKKTEQGKSSLGFTRVAAPRTYDPSRAAAPPPVPEARRQLLLNYFIRK